MISVKSKFGSAISIWKPGWVAYVRLLVIFVDLIPSSARAVSSHASPLPEQLVPLLKPGLDAVAGALERALPSTKKRNVLEEAEWEYEGEEDGGWEREMISQG